MRKINLSTIAALLVLALVLGACAAQKYGYHDGHGNQEGAFIP